MQKWVAVARNKLHDSTSQMTELPAKTEPTSPDSRNCAVAPAVSEPNRAVQPGLHGAYVPMQKEITRSIRLLTHTPIGKPIALRSRICFSYFS